VARQEYFRYSRDESQIRRDSMKEQQAYAVLGWPHDGSGNEGDGWLAFRCPTPGCQSEGVARSREFGFGRCGICGAIMEPLDSTSAQPRVQVQKPVPANVAKPAVVANIAQELVRARKLGEQLEELVVQRGECPDDDRNILLMAYWALIFDFHKGILTEIESQRCGSAFALVRPCVEALVRAHVAVKGSDEDVNKLQGDTYQTDFDKIGQWMDREFATEQLFTNFIGGAQAALHSFTHAGLSQIGRRFDGHTLKPSYDDAEILEVIRSTTSAAWMVTNLVTIHLGFVKEANKAQDLYLDWGKH
jgi:uncharacterized protein DUF6988